MIGRVSHPILFGFPVIVNYWYSLLSYSLLEKYAPVLYFSSMRTFSPLSGGLFFIECARFSFLTGILAVFRYNAGPAFPWQIYAVPNALFLLIALFLWLDRSKYTAYSLLYISGKSLCLFSEIISGIAMYKNVKQTDFFETGILNPGRILPIAFFIDLVTLIIILIGCTKNKKGGV